MLNLNSVTSKKTLRALCLSLTLPLTVVGCVTTESINTADTKQIVQKPQAPTNEKLADVDSKSRREELVNLLVDSFSAKEFLQSTINSNPNESKELLTCIGSNSTLVKVNKELKVTFLKNIEELSNDEVNQYINHLKKGGASALKKFYINNYLEATKVHQKKKINLQDSTIKLLASFTEQERKAFNSFDTLPNEDVREIILPRDKAEDETFRILLYNLPARWAMQDTCMQHIKKN